MTFTVNVTIDVEADDEAQADEIVSVGLLGISKVLAWEIEEVSKAK